MFVSGIRSVARQLQAEMHMGFMEIIDQFSYLPSKVDHAFHAPQFSIHNPDELPLPLTVLPFS